jgi:hypothetical protein
MKTKIHGQTICKNLNEGSLILSHPFEVSQQHVHELILCTWKKIKISNTIIQNGILYEIMKKIIPADVNPRLVIFSIKNRYSAIILDV